MSPSGFYRDPSGELRPDRRERRERRSRSSKDYGESDRRLRMRRHDDWQRLDREHAQWVDDALEEFSATHDRS